MRFRKRLSALILAIVMMVTSISIPGATSYAAQMTGGSTESGQTDGEEDKATNDGADETDRFTIEGAYQFGGAPDKEQTSKRSGAVFAVNGIAALFASASGSYDGLEAYLYQEMQKRTETIDISTYNITDVSIINRVVSGVLNEHPELYYVGSSWGLQRDGNGKVLSVSCTYTDGYDDTVFDTAVSEALADITDGMSDYEKAAALHDYLAVNIAYDYDNLQAGTVPMMSYNAYGALVEGMAVCQGYALAYKYLLGKVGIESYMVTSQSMKHAWNMVKIDGKYYHVDVTWDDPVWDMTGRASHVYLLRSDANIDAASSGNDKHTDWTVTSGSDIVDYQAADTTYESAFWTKSTAPLVFDADGYYYITAGGSLNKAVFSNPAGAGTELVSIGNWPVWGGSGTWGGAFSGLYKIDGRLYYNDATSIYSIRTDGTDKRTEFTADTSNGYIYGSAYRRGGVYYCLHQNPNLTEKETALTAELKGGSEEPGVEVDPPIPPDDDTAEGYNLDNPSVEYGTSDWDIWTGNYNTTVKDGQCRILIFSMDFDGHTEDARTLYADIRENNAYFKGGKVNLFTVALDESRSDNMEYTGYVNPFMMDFWGYGYVGDFGKTMVQAPGDDLSTRAAGLRQYTDVIMSKDTSVASTTYLPLVVYIDANNKIQYAERKKTDAFQMLKNLRKYCGYTGVYAIHYELGGGTNHRFNPSTYSDAGVESFYVPLYREGYRFDGWYLDRAYTKKITKIPAGTRSDITLYAKWTELTGGLDMENLHLEFTAADGTKLSSTADGKPKLLMSCPYYDSTGGKESRELLDAVQAALEADPNHLLSGVDVYAVCDVTDEMTEEKAKEYQNQWSHLKVVYKKDATDDVNLMSYVEMVGYRGTADVILKPYICYIDAQNRLQYVTIGGYSKTGSDTENLVVPTVSDILLNLQLYCRYPSEGEGFYQINYVMNRGTNDSANPPRYRKGMANIQLRDPVQESSRRFDGWYLDAEFTERITEIDTSSGGDITVYAKWKRNGYGISSRYGHTWTALDGSELSSHADGKPKLLIFGNYNCGFSEETVKAVAARSEWFRGADVYYISVYDEPENAGPDAPGKTPTSYVEQLKEDCGTDAIIFTKGGGDGGGGDPLQPYMWCLETGVPLSFWPNLVYIDKDDKLQYMSVGSTAENILDWLREYCDYDMSLIAYELGGGTNDSGNPATYTMETETITLKDAVREGFEFDGWYKDAAFTKKVTQIARGSSGDITLYAKWTKALEPGTYRITYELNGGVNDSGNPATYTEETETITLAGAVREGYIFDGWYKDAEFKEQVTAIAKGSKGDITLYAKWKEADATLTVTRPDRTTYKVGEELDVTGGKVTLTPETGKPSESVMTLSMLTGFDSSKPGMCKVMVTSSGYTGSFDVLIVEEPEIEIPYGKTLGSAAFPKCEYGAYAWADNVEPDKELTAGVYTYGAVFTPKDTEKFQTLTLQITVRVVVKLDDGNTKIEFLDGPYTYSGKGVQIKPQIRVIFTGEDGKSVTLAEGQDYRVEYDKNVNSIGRVDIFGINAYTGETGKNFDIAPAVLTLRVKDKTIRVGDPVPDPATDYEYEIIGLFEGDEDWLEASLAHREKIRFECGITDTSQEGEYTVKVYGLSSDSCYTLQYEPGTLYVVSELVFHKVIFDVQGHGTAPKAYSNVKTGTTINSPEEPKADGYRFGGWYKDPACTKIWDFAVDTVQSDLTLYAKWFSVSTDGEFAVQEIADVIYNGKAQKPAISVYDGDKLLKAGKDYTIKYYNNINVNADGMAKNKEFNEKLPYVAVTGKGNYKETVKINFNILRASLGDEFGNPGAGAVLKVNDHLVKANKALKPFGSLKMGRTLKLDTDFELTLKPVSAYDDSGVSLTNGQELENAVVPAGYTGEFQLTVKGKGNYEGSISRTVYVADKAHLMKNVKITLGKDLKNAAYTGSAIEPKAVGKAKPGNDEFVVTYGKTVLQPGTDYDVLSENDGSVGSAELVVVGKNGYVGRKAATFNIKGRAFTKGTVTVDGLKDSMVYTGRAVVQNQEAKLIWAKGKADEKELVYGQDYTISYSSNVNKGTATITFTGMASSGYSGTVKKTFKITAVDIANESQVTRDTSTQSISLPYSKVGAKPEEEIVLTNKEGVRLRYGKDYILAYKNNKAVADASAEKAPTVTVKGKGNYSGSFDVKFSITKADLRGTGIAIECAQAAYSSKKTDTYVYKPAVKVKDGKQALKAGKDYEITYVKNTQKDYMDYMAKLEAGTATDEDIPRAVITEKKGSDYSLQGEIRVPLQIYMTKLTKNNLSVQVGSAVYTGGQVRPEVTVTYSGESGSILLTEGVDYTLTYGANIASGKNKGSVTVKGLAPDYGGSVTCKFEITRKDLKYWFLPVIDNEK